MPIKIPMRKRSCFIEYLPRILHFMGYGAKRQAGGGLRILRCHLGLGLSSVIESRAPAAGGLRVTAPSEERDQAFAEPPAP
jgi:hypothetical protein